MLTLFPTPRNVNSLRFRFLLQHAAHRRRRPWRSLLAPRLQPLARLFDIRKHCWILERRAPRWHDHAHSLPHDPDFTVALKKQLVVDQSAVHDARHHLPVADHHPDEILLVASRRILLHRLFGRHRTKMIHEPRARLSQSCFATDVVKPEHQIHFVVIDLPHCFLLLLVVHLLWFTYSCSVLKFSPPAFLPAHRKSTADRYR